MARKLPKWSQRQVLRARAVVRSCGVCGLRRSNTNKLKDRENHTERETKDRAKHDTVPEQPVPKRSTCAICAIQTLGIVLEPWPLAAKAVNGFEVYGSTKVLGRRAERFGYNQVRSRRVGEQLGARTVGWRTARHWAAPAPAIVTLGRTPHFYMHVVPSQPQPSSPASPASPASPVARSLAERLSSLGKGPLSSGLILTGFGECATNVFY